MIDKIQSKFKLHAEPIALDDGSECGLMSREKTAVGVCAYFINHNPEVDNQEMSISLPLIPMDYGTTVSAVFGIPFVMYFEFEGMLMSVVLTDKEGNPQGWQHPKMSIGLEKAKKLDLTIKE